MHLGSRDEDLCTVRQHIRRSAFISLGIKQHQGSVVPPSLEKIPTRTKRSMCFRRRYEGVLSDFHKLTHLTQSQQQWPWLFSEEIHKVVTDLSPTIKVSTPTAHATTLLSSLLSPTTHANFTISHLLLLRFCL